MLTWLLIFLLAFAVGGWIGSTRRQRRVTAVAQEALACARRHAARVFEVQAERIAEVADLKKQNLALAERVAQQSELLSRASEREQEAARRLGYLFPRGLETPPSREDALSPTWCREEAMAEKASKLFVAGPDRQYVELTDNQRNQVAIDNLRGEDALPR